MYPKEDLFQKASTKTYRIYLWKTSLRSIPSLKFNKVPQRTPQSTSYGINRFEVPRNCQLSYKIEHHPILRADLIFWFHYGHVFKLWLNTLNFRNFKWIHKLSVRFAILMYSSSSRIQRKSRKYCCSCINILCLLDSILVLITSVKREKSRKKGFKTTKYNLRKPSWSGS